VTLRKFGNPTKFPARVEAVGHDCDLALLTVEDPLFWENMYALQLGDIPQRTVLANTRLRLVPMADALKLIVHLRGMAPRASARLV